MVLYSYQEINVGSLACSYASKKLNYTSLNPSRTQFSQFDNEYSDE